MPLVSFCKTPGCPNRADYADYWCYGCLQKLKAEHGKAQQAVDQFAAWSTPETSPRAKTIDPVLISDDVLRLFLLDPKNRTRVKDLMLTPGDDLLLQSVAKGHNTSSKIAGLSDTSVQSISLRLTNLRQRGYLSRVEVPQETGGYEWLYTNVYKQKGADDGQQL